MRKYSRLAPTETYWFGTIGTNLYSADGGADLAALAALETDRRLEYLWLWLSSAAIVCDIAAPRHKRNYNARLFRDSVAVTTTTTTVWPRQINSSRVRDFFFLFANTIPI